MSTAPIINNPKSTGDDSPVDVSNLPIGQDKWIGSAISAAAVLGSAIVGAISQHRTNEAAQQRQEDAYRQNLLQWERENAYSSPLAQRHRLESAGLNAALMYQNGTGSAAAAPSPQMSAAVPISPFAPGNAQEALLQIAQIANINADTEVKKEQANLTTIQSENGAFELSIKKEFLEDMTKEQLESLRKNNDKVGVEISEIKQKINNMKAEELLTRLEGDKLKYYIDNIQPKEYEHLLKQMNLTDAQFQSCVASMICEIAMTKSNMDLNSANAGLSRQLTKLNKELTTKAKVYNANSGGMWETIAMAAGALTTIGDKPFQFDLGKKIVKGKIEHIQSENADNIIEFLNAVFGLARGFF